MAERGTINLSSNYAFKGDGRNVRRNRNVMPGPLGRGGFGAMITFQVKSQVFQAAQEEIYGGEKS